jgi:hypothetical protein
LEGAGLDFIDTEGSRLITNILANRQGFKSRRLASAESKQRNSLLL